MSKLRLLLKIPTTKRGSFNVQIDHRNEADAKQHFSTLHDQRIDAINLEFKSGKITRDQGIELLKKFRADKQKEYALSHQTPYSSYNRATIKRYYDQTIALKHMIAKYTAWCELNRAIEVLGIEPLNTISNGDLQERLDTLPANRHYRMTSRLNSLLKFIGRPDVQLHPKPKMVRTPRHLTEQEFKEALKRVRDPLLKSLYVIAYTTGLRESEIHGLEYSDLRSTKSGKFLHLQRQYARKMKDTKIDRLRLPKNTRKRNVVPINQEEFLAAFTRWTNATREEKESLRYKASVTIKSICTELFKDKRTYGGVHMLRASHAIELINRDLSSTLGAMQMGHSIQVFQQSYAGFILLDEQLTLVQDKVNARVTK